MNRLVRLLEAAVKPAVFGMVHIRALPGSPLNKLSMSQITDVAVREATLLTKYNIRGLIIENMHDVPYLLPDSAGPELVASMSVICSELRKQFPDIAMGLQILAGCNRQALATAAVTDLDFIRAEGFIYSHVADEGLINACAGDLLRYRKHLNAEHVSIIADIKKKHSSHAITADLDVVQMSRDAEFFLADGVVITGDSTAQPADCQQLEDVKSTLKIPVFVGSGVTAGNVDQYSHADGLIIGSHFKKKGKWSNELSEERIATFMQRCNRQERLKFLRGKTYNFLLTEPE